MHPARGRHRLAPQLTALRPLHGLQMQRLSVVLHTAVAWQTVNELACGDSGIVHGAKCIAVLNGVA